MKPEYNSFTPQYTHTHTYMYLKRCFCNAICYRSIITQRKVMKPYRKYLKINMFLDVKYTGTENSINIFNRKKRHILYCYNNSSLDILTPVLIDCLYLEFKWQELFSSLQDFSQYAGRSPQCCAFDVLCFTSNFELIHLIWVWVTSK